MLALRNPLSVLTSGEISLINWFSALYTRVTICVWPKAGLVGRAAVDTTTGVS